MDPDNEFKAIPIATEAFANRIKDLVLAEFSSERDINVWVEGDCGDMEKQLSFTIWYDTREIREQAHMDGEADRLEKLFRETAVKEGYPEDQLDRLFVWTDSHQALARLSGTEPQFNEWLNKKNSPDVAEG